jgi:hypothetical protein
VRTVIQCVVQAVDKDIKVFPKNAKKLGEFPVKTKRDL